VSGCASRLAAGNTWFRRLKRCKRRGESPGSCGGLQHGSERCRDCRLDWILMRSAVSNQRSVRQLGEAEKPSESSSVMPSRPCHRRPHKLGVPRALCTARPLRNSAPAAYTALTFTAVPDSPLRHPSPPPPHPTVAAFSHATPHWCSRSLRGANLPCCANACTLHCQTSPPLMCRCPQPS